MTVPPRRLLTENQVGYFYPNRPFPSDLRLRGCSFICSVSAASDSRRLLVQRTERWRERMTTIAKNYKIVNCIVLPVTVNMVNSQNRLSGNRIRYRPATRYCTIWGLTSVTSLF